jgi:hypothetical protein
MAIVCLVLLVTQLHDVADVISLTGLETDVTVLFPNAPHDAFPQVHNVPSVFNAAVCAHPPDT